MRIVRTIRYQKDLKRIGASASDINALEQAIAFDPAIGDVIPGLGGIRKLRFGLGRKGKRGGARAIYFLMVFRGHRNHALCLCEERAGRPDHSTAESGARDHEDVH